MKITPCLAALAFFSVTSATFLHAQDVFDARGERVVVVKPKPAPAVKPTRAAPSITAPVSAAPKGDTVRLRRGEVREVFKFSRGASPEMAFYLPPEGVGIVQLTIESKGSQVSYFLKGLRGGRTVGGAVERRWLDREGFSARNPADEARIQAALKRHPLHIVVE